MAEQFIGDSRILDLLPRLLDRQLPAEVIHGHNWPGTQGIWFERPARDGGWKTMAGAESSMIPLRKDWHKIKTFPAGQHVIHFAPMFFV